MSNSQKKLRSLIHSHTQADTPKRCGENEWTGPQSSLKIQEESGTNEDKYSQYYRRLRRNMVRMLLKAFALRFAHGSFYILACDDGGKRRIWNVLFTS